MTGADDTIFALGSGAGRSGVAVIRVSGRRAGAALRDLTGPLPPPRRATVRDVRARTGDPPIDRALILWLPGPASYTGEDMAELHVHGGRAVIHAVLAALGSCCRLRMAEPGEFTRRAFANGKLDLTAAEGVADLIDAETEAQRRQALRQAGGALHVLYEGWRARLIEAMALLEATLDFADEGDVPGDVIGPAWKGLARLSDDMRRHLDDGRRGEILREGFHVVLAGAPNVGKSSLLNALAHRDVAIVSPEAGTTRDIVEVRLDLGGMPIVLSDTAGLRPTDNAVEAEGIRRTLARTGESDLVVWTMDATQPSAKASELPAEVVRRPADTLWIMNKADLVASDRVLDLRTRGDPSSPPRALTEPRSGSDNAKSPAMPPTAGPLTAGLSIDTPLAVSAKTGAGIDRLVVLLTDAARARLGDQSEPPPTRIRHRLELDHCHAALGKALHGDRQAVELRAEDLRVAATALGRVTGRIDVEDILDRIFASFCIGK